MALFQLIEEHQIRQTTDFICKLFDWIEEIAGTEEAINVQSWCEFASFDEIYQGEGFKVKCLKL